MKDAYDVVIVGGAVIGSSVAYFLAANPDFRGSILIVERDPTFRYASTSLSAASIRVQYSNPINVKISQFGRRVHPQFSPRLMQVGDDRPDLGFHEAGYLFLAASEDQAQMLRENHAVQRACGADVALLWRATRSNDAFPHLRVDDVLLASYGRSGEGWFSNTGLMNGMRAKARALGADYVVDEVVAIGRAGAKVDTVTLKSGQTIRAGTIVNASGPRARGDRAHGRARHSRRAAQAHFVRVRLREVAGGQRASRRAAGYR